MDEQGSGGQSRERSGAGSVDRRSFLAGTATVPLAAHPLGGAAVAAPLAEPDPVLANLSLRVNGEPRALAGVDTRTTLLDLLRENLGLAGSKKGCDHGQCGACTVLVGGRRINACLALAVALEGEEVTTVEGLSAPDGAPHPLQAGFVRHDGLQCGYCTPGQLVSALGMLEEARLGWSSAVTEDVRASFGGLTALTEAEVRERMSGNLCRCGAYNGIVAAVREAAGHPPGTEPEGGLA